MDTSRINSQQCADAKGSDVLLIASAHLPIMPLVEDEQPIQNRFKLPGGIRQIYLYQPWLINAISNECSPENCGRRRYLAQLAGDITPEQVAHPVNVAVVLNRKR